MNVEPARKRPRALGTKRRREIALRNAEMWAMSRRGVPQETIAAIFGLDPSNVWRGIKAAEALAAQLRLSRDPDLAPLFGCEPWTNTLVESRRDSIRTVPEPVCRVCESNLQPGDPWVCMRCDESGHDAALADSLGRTVIAGLNPRADRPRTPAAPPDRPRLTVAHRIELARTPQGRIWLESIGQLPGEAEEREYREKRLARKTAS